MPPNALSSRASRRSPRIRVALPLAAIEERLAEIRRLVWTTAALTAAAGMALAFWLARRITRPLQELTAGA